MNEANQFAVSEIARLVKLVDSKQMIIDNLMMEYCPNEMTEAQKENWAKHQVPSTESL